jgi:hypothetical protein
MYKTAEKCVYQLGRRTQRAQLKDLALDGTILNGSENVGIGECGLNLVSLR